jgi:phosphoribosyl 1,2-cyclic phosphodiesterase
MKLTFYGVRGSVPTPGRSTMKYGGNTTSILLESDLQELLILDAGTGIRQLGLDIQNSEHEIYILLSHNHWDHIQGFPYFVPAYMPESQITIIPGLTDLEEPDAILQQMKGSFFPISAEDLSAKIKIKPIKENCWHHNSYQIERRKMNHPGGGSAYKILVDDTSIVYATDNELFPPYPVATAFEEWIAFAKQVDYLIHDGQYLPEDYPFKRGWGHSQIQHALDLALQAQVKNLVLVSHDPDRTDDQIDKLQAELSQSDYPFNIIFAYEGLTL